MGFLFVVVVGASGVVAAETANVEQQDIEIDICSPPKLNSPNGMRRANKRRERICQVALSFFYSCQIVYCLF